MPGIGTEASLGVFIEKGCRGDCKEISLSQVPAGFWTLFQALKP